MCYVLRNFLISNFLFSLLVYILIEMPWIFSCTVFLSKNQFFYLMLNKKTVATLTIVLSRWKNILCFSWKWENQDVTERMQRNVYAFQKCKKCHTIPPRLHFVKTNNYYGLCSWQQEEQNILSKMGLTLNVPYILNIHTIKNIQEINNQKTYTRKWS